MSACLLGRACRYDTKARVCPHTLLLRDAGVVHVIPVCPEILGGLSVPRSPAAIVGGDGFDVLGGRAAILTDSGKDVTDAYLRGLAHTATIVEYFRPVAVVLKERSPACGLRRIHDGHTGRLRSGPGLAAAWLQRNRPEIRILTEEDLGDVPADEFRRAAWSGRIPPCMTERSEGFPRGS